MQESAPAAGAGAHSKAPHRRKKGASAAGQIQQQRKARSASASIAVPLRSCEVLEAEHAAVGGGAKQQQQQQQQQQQSLPPRSPVKTAKVCVPTLEDALDDVQVRFVLNLPEAELSSADRLFFQLEQAWWFYEDFIADAHKHLPHFKLKEFAKLLFQHCEALRPLSGKYNELFEYFRSWKGTIPTAGCILLNAAMTDIVLVKMWKSNSRGLPKGKINQGEPPIEAALREVQEETGYDARGGANEKDFLTLYLNGQQTTMYIVVGVDETFPFEPQVRKEISAIEWFPLDALPKGSFGVEPFIPRLRRWMAKTKGVRAPKTKNAAAPEARTQSLLRTRKAFKRATSPDVSRAVATAVASSQSQPSSPTGAASSNGGASSSKKQNRKGSKGGAGGKDHAGSPSMGGDSVRSCSAPNRRGVGSHHAKPKGFDRRNRDTFGRDADDVNGDGGGNDDGWDFEAMLAANERLTGRTFVYDGNPHDFGDPAHAARVSTPATAATALASAPAHAPALSTSSRTEDQVGHVKQRSGRGKGGGGRQGTAAAAAAATSAAPAAGDFPGNGNGNGGGKSKSGRSRSRGKAREAAQTVSATNSNINTTGIGLTARDTASDGNGNGNDNGNGNGNSSGDSLGLAASNARSQTAANPCTEEAEGVGGTGGCPAVSLWGEGDAPAAGTSSAGGAGLNVFGDFKFDMLDIMSAVPQV